MNLGQDSVGMLRSIRLKNFKCYRDSGVIELAPLTVLIGCNNSGKSSILQALLALTQTLRSNTSTRRLITRGPLVDLGSFRDIVYRRASESVGIELVRDVVPDDDISDANKLSLTFALDPQSNKIVVANVAYANDSGAVFDYSHGDDHSKPILPEVQQQFLTFRMVDFLPTPYLVPSNQKLFAEHAGSVLKAFNAVFFPTQHWRMTLDRIVHVAPLRTHVPFHAGIGYRRGADEVQHEELLKLIGSGEKLEGSSASLLESLKFWLTSRLRALSDLRLKRVDQAGYIHSLLGKSHRSKVAVNIAAMGEGISQLLPVLSSVLCAVQGQTLLIEQPEIHLHPALQAELGDFFVEQAALPGRQIVVESHSEHMLLRIRRRVAEGAMDPSNVSVLFVERDGDESKVQRLALNGNGHFDDWPAGFFEESYREAVALALATKG